MGKGWAGGCWEGSADGEGDGKCGWRGRQGGTEGGKGGKGGRKVREGTWADLTRGRREGGKSGGKCPRRWLQAPFFSSPPPSPFTPSLPPLPPFSLPPACLPMPRPFRHPFLARGALSPWGHGHCRALPSECVSLCHSLHCPTVGVEG
ncbi:hypothetical protein Naga_102703g1 [Nannochloropsis gaditana]|uniref:Uncharacterized protein n=1 Tax=Nannochloropsis gaditana TaxID=72520 RepID=W7TI85_9STRA|nr:hypothetical protein Naga_102703g1 [Nannochloropsis gaditana]